MTQLRAQQRRNVPTDPTPFRRMFHTQTTDTNQVTAKFRQFRHFSRSISIHVFLSPPYQVSDRSFYFLGEKLAYVLLTPWNSRNNRNKLSRAALGAGSCVPTYVPTVPTLGGIP